MGQSLRKHESQEEKKAKVIIEAAERYYDEHSMNDQSLVLADFYRAVSEAVEALNRSLDYTQFQVPDKAILKKAFDEVHHRNEGKSLTKEEFQQILRGILMNTRFTGIGAKDILLYMFGVPITTLFIKKRLMPNVMPNEVFISGVTSATVLVLAKLNKI